MLINIWGKKLQYTISAETKQFHVIHLYHNITCIGIITRYVLKENLFTDQIHFFTSEFTSGETVDSPGQVLLVQMIVTVKI